MWTLGADWREKTLNDGVCKYIYVRFTSEKNLVAMESRCVAILGVISYSNITLQLHLRKCIREKKRREERMRTELTTH